MKIICVGRNYAAHAHELGNDVPTEPLIFMKPDTAILRDDKPFYYPDFSTNIHYECEVVLRVARSGKYIAPEFAYKYIDAVTVGIDFTARDIQDRLKAAGQPWEIAKGFNGSAVVGKMRTLAEAKITTAADLRNIDFHLLRNGAQVQKSNTALQLFPFDTLIAYVSRFFTLSVGDFIYTGTPEGVGAIAVGDTLEGFLGEERLFVCEIK